MFFQTCCLEKNSWFFQTNCLILVWLFQTTLQQALLRLHSSYKQMKHVEVLFQQFCLFSFISNVFQTNGDLTFTCSLWSACVVKLGCYMLCSGAFPNPFFAGVFPNSWFWCHACLWCFSKHHTSPTMCFSKHLLQSFPRLTALDNGWRTCPQLQQKCQNCPQPESTCGAGSGFWWGTHPTPIACIPGKFFDCHQKLPWHPSHRQCGICPCAQLGPSRLLFQKAAHGRAPRCGCLPSPFLPLCQMPHSSRCTPCILRPEAPRHADPCLRWHHCSPGSDASPQWPVAFPSQAFPSQWWSWALPWSWAFPNPWTFPNPSSCWAFPNPEACRRRTRLQSPFPKAQQGSRWPSWLCHLSPCFCSHQPQSGSSSSWQPQLPRCLSPAASPELFQALPAAWLGTSSGHFPAAPGASPTPGDHLGFPQPSDPTAGVPCWLFWWHWWCQSQRASPSYSWGHQGVPSLTFPNQRFSWSFGIFQTQMAFPNPKGFSKQQAFPNLWQQQGLFQDHQQLSYWRLCELWFVVGWSFCCCVVPRQVMSVPMCVCVDKIVNMCSCTYTYIYIYVCMCVWLCLWVC